MITISGPIDAAAVMSISLPLLRSGKLRKGEHPIHPGPRARDTLAQSKPRGARRAERGAGLGMNRKKSEG